MEPLEDAKIIKQTTGNSPALSVNSHLRAESVGEIRASETLVFHFYPDVLRLAASLIRNPVEAEDIAQESFIYAAASLQNLRGEAHIKTWLFGITANLCKTQYRKYARRNRLIKALFWFHIFRPRPATPAENTLENVTHTQRWHAVASLNDKHRFPVLLHYVHDLSASQSGAVYIWDIDL